MAVSWSRYRLLAASRAEKEILAAICARRRLRICPAEMRDWREASWRLKLGALA